MYQALRGRIASPAGCRSYDLVFLSYGFGKGSFPIPHFRYKPPTHLQAAKKETPSCYYVTTQMYKLYLLIMLYPRPIRCRVHDVCIARPMISRYPTCVILMIDRQPEFRGGGGQARVTAHIGNINARHKDATPASDLNGEKSISPYSIQGRRECMIWYRMEKE